MEVCIYNSEEKKERKLHKIVKSLKMFGNHCKTLLEKIKFYVWYYLNKVTNIVPKKFFK